MRVSRMQRLIGVMKDGVFHKDPGQRATLAQVA
jgi:hypothetical protein